MQVEIPKINSLWYHKATDKQYTVIIVANENATKQGYPIIIVYRDNDNNIWAKDLNKFMLSMSSEDRQARGVLPLSNSIKDNL